jgi:hypothetical protein
MGIDVFTFHGAIDEIKTEIKENAERTNGNIVLLNQRLDALATNQASIAKALMQLSSPQADQFALSSPPPLIYATTGITST